MRIFTNCLEMLSEVHRDLFEMGIRVKPKTMQDKVIVGNAAFETIELSGYSFAIMDTSDIDAMIQLRNLNLKWCYADLEERLSEEEINPGTAYKLRPEWSEFVHGTKFAYTYNERIRNQLRDTIDVLEFDNASRQAVISIYNGAIDSEKRGGISRVPCSMYYQFLIRGNKLDVIYTMRSSDFMTHFPYDIWMATQLQMRILEELNNRKTINAKKIQLGKVVFFSGSLHAYAKDVPHTF